MPGLQESSSYDVFNINTENDEGSNGHATPGSFVGQYTSQDVSFAVEPHAQGPSVQPAIVSQQFPAFYPMPHQIYAQSSGQAIGYWPVHLQPQPPYAQPHPQPVPMQQPQSVLQSKPQSQSKPRLQAQTQTLTQAQQQVQSQLQPQGQHSHAHVTSTYPQQLSPSYFPQFFQQQHPVYVSLAISSYTYPPMQHCVNSCPSHPQPYYGQYYPLPHGAPPTPTYYTSEQLNPSLSSGSFPSHGHFDGGPPAPQQVSGGNMNVNQSPPEAPMVQYCHPLPQFATVFQAVPPSTPAAANSASHMNSISVNLAPRRPQSVDPAHLAGNAPPHNAKPYDKRNRPTNHQLGPIILERISAGLTDPISERSASAPVSVTRHLSALKYRTPEISLIKPRLPSNVRNVTQAHDGRTSATPSSQVQVSRRGNNSFVTPPTVNGGPPSLVNSQLLTPQPSLNLEDSRRAQSGSRQGSPKQTSRKSRTKPYTRKNDPDLDPDFELTITESDFIYSMVNVVCNCKFLVLDPTTGKMVPCNEAVPHPVLQEHFEKGHKVPRKTADPGLRHACCWEGCGQMVNDNSILRHLTDKHSGRKYRCGFEGCDHEKTRKSDLKKHFFNEHHKKLLAVTS